MPWEAFPYVLASSQSGELNFLYLSTELKAVRPEQQKSTLSITREKHFCEVAFEVGDIIFRNRSFILFAGTCKMPRASFSLLHIQDVVKAKNVAP